MWGHRTNQRGGLATAWLHIYPLVRSLANRKQLRYAGTVPVSSPSKPCPLEPPTPSLRRRKKKQACSVALADLQVQVRVLASCFCLRSSSFLCVRVHITDSTCLLAEFAASLFFFFILTSFFPPSWPTSGALAGMMTRTTCCACLTLVDRAMSDGLLA
ncbi:hypothetical protein B0J18DRAFT_223994 [Chaetomium sp. MPI-SDFR-AT-0129]|nr:hypothetical protein B0J18DRAFT_223994 [Chaetomium sp. MPI-SDFR-AT-0129]